MTEPVTGPASLHELGIATLMAAREASGRLVESGRQVQNLLSQSADVMASGVGELHEMGLRHAREHLEVSFLLAQGLAEAAGQTEVLSVLNRFARETAESCASQADELSRFAARFAPRVASSDDLIGDQA
jgi:Phasin protein